MNQAHTIHGIIMNLCSYKPLMGTGSKELLNTQTANYCVGLVNWLCPLFRMGAWSVWQIYGAVAHVHNIDVLKKHIFGYISAFSFSFFFLPEYAWEECDRGINLIMQRIWWELKKWLRLLWRWVYARTENEKNLPLCVIQRLSHMIRWK